MTLPSPIVTPGKTNARAPIKASAPIVIFAAVRGILDWEKIVADGAEISFLGNGSASPISISPREYDWRDLQDRHDRAK
jgi:hypothetical protein